MTGCGTSVRYRVFSRRFRAHKVQHMNMKAISEVPTQPMQCLVVCGRGEVLHAGSEIPLVRSKDTSQVDQVIWNIGRESRQSSTVNRHLFMI